MLRLGLPRDVAEEMLASWTTHEAYIRNFYSSEEDKFSLPKEAPDQEVLAKLAKQQSDALQFQLDSIEAYEKAYGQESLNEIINNFGIYNFGRYRQLELYEQNQRWLSGEPVGSVVVNARFDWNSYTGKNPVFQDEQGKGVFIFEANSGTETARIAVRVGQRERQQGRQPDVKRFIVHAHGNEDGMTIGTSGESIDTRMYRQAARDRTKIPGSEVNDYKKHLGENFEVILQSCSTAGENVGPNIATVMSEGHDVKVTASSVTISGLIIRSDGSVQFSTGLANTEPVIIQPTD